MLSDTIAALATAPGRAAIALIRVSGRDAFGVAARVLRPFDGGQPRRARRSQAVAGEAHDPLDDVLYAVFPAPASYTGEDMVEITTHGGLLVPGEVLGALLAAGARPAAPGEFTRRALANGKLDLLQAEAIADLVDATAPAQRRAALQQLDRGLSARLGGLRDEVLALEALLSYDLDFPEEDSGPVAPARVDAALVTVRAAVGDLLATAADGERLREGALCVIAGRPNTGKSSLFNALLGRERAIVTDRPGTTRDAIEAPATCDGFPFRLVDTAGLRDSDDLVERLGIEVSWRYLAAADVVLLCVEAGRPLVGEERLFLDALQSPALLVRTKGDLEASAPADPAELRVSALRGDGLPALRERLAGLAFATLATHADLAPVITRERHRVALARALAELEAFAAARASGLEPVVATTYLRAAVTALEDVIGVVTGEDVLDRVFASFCVGK
ncbi:MAG: tRNA uridine-5-carboxymethylaminomethyl(34) synthesis GTPase MnmE [Gemmatimonadota bacterium]|nr:tRNA uridine-5-carboxymethylaminomethyl(34) synthesis GTPase MnmE [Gemmatimonadota bacterium]